MKILITGATGLVGQALIRNLLAEGHEVRALARSPQKVQILPSSQVFKWSDDQQPSQESLKDIEAIIHLAGESVADKSWSAERKARLRDSRIRGTHNLIEALKKMPAGKRPQTFISASAIGFYGDTGENAVNESSSAGKGFLSELTQEWEASALQAKSLGLRTVLLRTGVALSRDGGALTKMAPVILGSGQQWMSWIHIEDLVQFIQFSLQEPSCEGAYNLTSPEPVRNKTFTQLFSKSRRYPMVLQTPAFVLRIVLGEMSSILLDSQKVLPERVLQAGYKFRFANLTEALDQIYGEDHFLNQSFSVDQFVPCEKNEVFAFFSRAENLEILTPPWLNFRIKGMSTEKIAAGTLIDYKLSIHGVPVHWRTEINQWTPEQSFVDDQLTGPYKKWHHVHTFTAVPGGTLLRDEVTYRVPGHLLGKLALSAWIRRDINAIFSFRQMKIRELFG